MKTKRSMSKKRLGSAKRGVVVKGEWKAVKIDPSMFADEAMGELVCFEELTDYSLVESQKAANMAQMLQETTRKKRNKRKASERDREVEIFEEEQEVGELSSEDDDEQVDYEEKPAKKQKKKKKKKQVIEAKTKHLNKDEHVECLGSLESSATLLGARDDQTPQDSEGATEVTMEQTLKTSSKKVKRKSAAEQTEAASEVAEADTQLVGPVHKSKRKVKNWTDAALSNSEGQDTDVSAWNNLFVPDPVLKALSKLGYSSPTPIQALALPPAIRDHMDILGAAETGSGKTLSFGIPMIHTILEWKKSCNCKLTGTELKPDSVTQVESIYLSPVTNSKASDSDADISTKKGDVSGEMSDGTGGETADKDNKVKDSSAHKNEKMDDEDIIEETPEDGDSADPEKEIEEEGGDCGSPDADENQDGDGVTGAEEGRGGGGVDSEKQPLLGLVLTPTRELAVQVKHHIDAVAQFTGIRTAIVVGGMAPQKQDRILKRRPEIVIATPGRLWEMVQEKHLHLRNLRQLRCLVIDEADRMVEKGHFAELENLLELLNTSQFNPKRQTFVFSATLTMMHSLPSRLLRKKSQKMEQRSKLELLMEKVGIKAKPKVIDLTRKEATVETLTETRILCEKEEKDFYLYYFLLQYPGRTMVFANSIDCIKRLTSLLTIMDCNPLPLHANMHQKQRLKNLERFAERESCVLLTTDVAARGLDIPNVQHVIHYQVPRTSETYVHRSGRTARAAKEGLSLLLVGPDDLMNYKKIYRTLGKDEDLPFFPVQNKCMAAIKERVDVARKIEKMEYHHSRQKQHNSWFRQAAEDMDIDLDDDLLLGGGRNEDEDDREQQKLVKVLKKQLKHLLCQPVFKPHMKTRYPTQMGKLQLPQLPLANETALISVSKQQQKTKQRQKRNQ
ncbi:ATP-dependent RNA helicase DDX24 [Brachyhypopomus gauderio]|uniref:ATP-dependent RNA helicase DDX24 n=1 Tax=Brachyhypopomus gauderio TaxID=698409 RepID=UPI004041726F